MIPQDQVKIISSIFMSIPLCFLLRKLKGSVRKYYSLILGTLFQCYMFGTEVWIPYLTHIIIYSVVLLKGRKCGFAVTVVAIVGYSIYNIFLMVVDYADWQVDVTALLMGNVCKYSFFAYAYQDGGLPDQKLKTAQQRREKMDNLVSFLDFCSYIQFLPAGVISYPISYHKYKTYISQQQPFQNIPLKQSFIKMGKDFSLFLLTAGLHVFGGQFLPSLYMREPAFTEENGFWYLIFYTFLSSLLTGCKYMVAFQMGILPMHAAGVTYSPQLPDKFSGIKLVDLYVFFTSTSVPARVNAWNTSCQEWLRKCVYERLQTSKDMARLITFLVSAVWHGFYGGYYLTFFTFFMLAHLATLIFKLSKYPNSPLVKLYNSSEPLSRYIVLAFLTYYFGQTGVCFLVLSLPTCFRILSAIYFVPQLILILGIVVVQVSLGMEKKKQKTKKS